MRLLCVSDTDDSIVYSPGGKQYIGKLDLALSCGDLPLECYDYISTIYHCDLCYVYGNHNLQHFNRTAGSKNPNFEKYRPDELFPIFFGNMIDGKSIYLKKQDLIIVGLGGCMLYNGGPSQYSERQMEKRISKLFPYLLKNKIKYGRYLDILLTHAPPFGIGDGEDLCHTGFKCFISFMDKYNPKFLLHGHVHLDDINSVREHVYGSTRIINVYNHYLLNI